MSGYALVRAVSQPAALGRILVNGVDITWFRATGMGPFQPTLVPGFTLIEPFAYGSSQDLVIPRTNSLLERYGTGELAWLHKGARVQYQRQTDDGLVTDYRGFITAVKSSGREWVAEVAGEVSGRASLIDKQPPLVRKVFDLGSLMNFACETLGLHLTPHGGPDTGLTAPNQGGTTWLSWMTTIGALSRTHDSNQRVLMPTTWGGTTWAFEPMDTDTVDFTVYADGQRITLDLVDDLAEQPTTVFGNGVTTDGERWRGSKYPGFFQGTPAPYPFSDDTTTFGIGTTDADTDTGDGITVMVKKLAWAGFLNDTYSSHTEYTIYEARAVNRLKDAAGLTEDGVMTHAAWLALWDADVVGFSPEGARIFPLAEATRVRSWNYSSTGAIIGRNPDHQAGSIRVDRTIDYGVCDKADATAHARSLINSTGGHQWAGTITLNNVSVFAGEHDGTDAADLTAEDMMVRRDIRPGMNAWLPYFDGGVLLHVSQVDHNADTTTLTVSSAALDVFDLTQALQRNAESKRNVYREWSEQNRGVRPTNRMISSDEFFGRLYTDVPLLGGQWNVVPIIMGQSGSVSRNDIRLTDAATRFCYFISDKEVTGHGLDGILGDPRDKDADGLLVWEHESVQHYFLNRDIRFVKGQGAQPCGFSWMKGYNDDGTRRTAIPLTGTDLDDSGWNYGCDPKTAPVVFFAIWPYDDCTLQRGHLFHVLTDDVT